MTQNYSTTNPSVAPGYPDNGYQATGYEQGSYPATPTGTERSTMDEARDVGSHAAQAGSGVAQTAKEQGAEVISETTRQARDLYGQARGQLASQAGEQQRRAAGGLRSLADEMRSMADNGGEPGPVSQFARQAADRVHGAAGWLEQREPGDLLHEVRDYARRNPTTFIVGAALLGIVAGRLTRNVAAVSGKTDQPTGAHRRGNEPTTAVPTAGYPGGTAATAGYAGGAEPTGYAGGAGSAGYAGGVGAAGYAGGAGAAGYGQPTTYASSAATDAYLAGGPEGHGGLPPASETDPLPGVPSTGSRS